MARKRAATSADAARVAESLRKAWQVHGAARPQLFDQLTELATDLEADTQPHRRRLLELIQSLDEADDAPIEFQELYVAWVNGLLIRLGAHFPCPTCGKASVLAHRRTASCKGERGAIVAQHVPFFDRTRHVPRFWRDVTTLVDRVACPDPGSTSAGPQVD